MQSNNQQNQVSQASAGIAQQAIPVKTTPSSSPWEEELDLQEETNKNAPTIIGSLGPSEVPNPKTLKVPEGVEEKVGKEITVSEIVGPAQVAPVVPVAAKPAVVEGVQSAIPHQAEAKINDIKPQTGMSEQSTAVVANEVTPPRPVVESIKPPTNNTSTPSFDEIDWFGGMSNVQTQSVDKPVTGINDRTEGIANMAKPVEQKVETDPGVSLAENPIKPVEEKEDVPDAPQSMNALADTVPPTVENPTIEKNISKKKISVAKQKLANLNVIKIALSFLGSIVIALILIIALNEYGIFSIGLDKAYGKIGLERVWGGLSSNPGIALAQSMAEMKNQPNFKARGKIDLKVDTTIKTTISKPIISESYGIESVSTDVLFYNSTDTSHAEIKVTNSMGESTLLVQNKGDKIYVKGDEKISYAEDYNKWAEFMVGALNGKVLQSELYNLNGNIGILGERLGVEKIEGKNCYHYRLNKISIGSSFENIGIASNMVQSMEGDVWIGVKDKLISKIAVRIVTPVSAAFSMVEANLTFFDYGVTNIIESIDENQIETADDRKTPAATSGDAKRKADVATIIKALEEYKAVSGSFPNSNNQLVSLNNNNNLVYRALVPQYLKTFPKEENELFNWYYAYKSDGQKCSVSARLANSSDPEAQLSGNLVLYIKYNSD